MNKKITSAIETKVRKEFQPQEVEAVLSAFTKMKEPPAEGEWETTRERVQAAILISAQSKLERLLKGVSNSQLDWRDTLVTAGLDEENWRNVAKESGFDID